MRGYEWQLLGIAMPDVIIILANALLGVLEKCSVAVVRFTARGACG